MNLLYLVRDEHGKAGAIVVEEATRRRGDGAGGSFDLHPQPPRHETAVRRGLFYENFAAGRHTYRRKMLYRRRRRCTCLAHK